MVIAVEASGREFDRLIDNIALNNLMNVRALHFALSDKPGIVELPIADDKTAATILWRRTHLCISRKDQDRAGFG